MEQGYDDSLENVLRIIGMDAESEAEQQDLLIEKSREYNTLLNEFARTGASEEEVDEFARAIVTELNSECSYIYKPVELSGVINKATKVFDEDSEERWAIMPQLVDKLPAQSLGFAWRNNGEIVGVVHSFSLINEQAIEIFGGVVQRSTIPRAFANLDSVSIDYSRSLYEASVALQRLAEDLIAEVDEAMLNSMSTTEIMQKLSEICPADIYNDLPTNTLADVASYVMGTIGIDTSVPYEIEVNHSFMTEDQSGEMQLCLPDRTQVDGGSKRILGYIQGVSFTDSREIVGDMCIVTEAPHFALDVRVVHDESVGGEANYEINVLMKDVGYCESLRDLLRAN